MRFKIRYQSNLYTVEQFLDKIGLRVYDSNKHKHIRIDELVWDD